MSKKRGSVLNSVYNHIKPLVEEAGLSLWDVRYEKEGSNWFLRVIIDKEGGVMIEDCEAIHNPISELLDKLDPIKQSYIFEVTSAGLGRELSTGAHFDACIGQEVRVVFIRPQDGVKEIEGILLSHDKDFIEIECDGEKMRITKSDLAYTKLNDDKGLF